MRFSEQWLREWVNPKLTTEALVEQLTMAGLEVDTVERAAPDFSHVVVGHVLSTKPHPDADRLRVCQVNVGSETVEIVCGASNVREGLRVAVILVGGVLPDGTQIKKAKLRGITSHGMICSARELGLSDEHAGILELPMDAHVGQDFRDYYKLDDAIIDVELTPNRGDCASVQGIAREVAALNQMALNTPEIKPISSQIEAVFPVEVQAPSACPRYVGRMIRGIHRDAKTPLWMQEKLRRSGLRPIHPVVDVTNYVMLELGQPLHAFDQARCEGGIQVRFAKKGETLTLLDGQSVTCDESTLLIADHQKPLALAGIMGCENSEVTDATSDLFLESAFFTPQGVALTARRLGLQTDASYRFERGVDFTQPARAIERATQLLLDIVGGEPGPVSEVAFSAHSPSRESVALRRDQISRVLGVALSDDEVEQALAALQITVNADASGWLLEPPAYRFDLNQEIDFIEEIARLRGYDKILPAKLYGALELPNQTEREVSTGRLMRCLVDRDYREAITYSFVDPKMQEQLDPERSPIALANPLATDMGVMRTTLWPGLIQALQYNQRRQHPRVRLFEIGLCFLPDAKGGCDQVSHLGGVVSGNAQPLQWGAPERVVDFYDVKGDLDALLALTGRSAAFEWRKGAHPALHPGQTADLFLEGERVGCLGALHPELLESLGVSDVYLFELRLSALQGAELPAYHAVSKFPAIRRDLALIVDEVLEVKEICQKIKAFSGYLLNKVEIFDIYQGKGVEPGKKSVALGLTFQDPSRTLVDREINQLIQQVVAGLEQELGVTLRA